MIIELQHDNLRQYSEVVIEPPTHSPFQGKWPPSIISIVMEGCVRIPNLTSEPIKITKSHFAHVRSVFILTPSKIDIHTPPLKGILKSPIVNFSDSVKVAFSFVHMSILVQLNQR